MIYINNLKKLNHVDLQPPLSHTPPLLERQLGSGFEIDQIYFYIKAVILVFNNRNQAVIRVILKLFF